MKIRFVVIGGPHQGEARELDGGSEIWIGRDPACAIALPSDGALAPRECRVSLDPQGFRIQPAEAAGATYVNGARVEESPLFPGDQISLGSSVLRFESVEGFAQAPTIHLDSTEAHCARCGTKLSIADSLKNLADSASTGEYCPRCQELLGLERSDTSRRMRTIVAGDPLLGREFGVYEILAFVGEGETGRVYQARHRILKEFRALKFLKASYAAAPEKLRRFFQGVQAATRLDHPSIVKAFDANVIDGHYFFAMEYVRGATLARALREKGRLHWRLVVAIAQAVAQGLDHAYRKHVVHRDLKPSNIVLARGGVVKISDFGLAKTLADRGSELTKEAEGFGTFPYIPPEQIQSAREADHRSDLYSLGVTMYHALTGSLPFLDENPPIAVIVYRIYTDTPPPVREKAPEVPPALARTVERLMAKRPEDRFQTPAELLAAIERTG